MQVCPAGHFSKDPQQCDLCGLPMGSDTGPGEPGPRQPDGSGAPTRAIPAVDTPGPDAAQAATVAIPAGPAPEPTSQAATTAMPVVDTSSAATTAIPAEEIVRASHAAATVLPDEAPRQATRVMPADNPAATSLLPATEATPVPPAPSRPAQVATEFIPVPPAEPLGKAADGREDRPAPGDIAGPPTGATVVLGGARGPGHWHAVLTVDAAWYAVQETQYRMPPEGAATVVQLTSASVTLGRVSRTLGTTPDIDCSSDPGVSRRHARFELVDGRWYVEDLDSANGTYLAHAGAPLPQNPIPAGRRVEVGPGDTVYVGAWTRVSIEDDDAWGPA